MTGESKKIVVTEELVSELKAKGMSSDDILNVLINPKATQEQSKNLEVRVSELLRTLGIPAHIKGYRYVRRAIIIAIENPNISITKELYPSVAKEFQTTGSRVERGIRHAIELSSERCNIDTINEIFGNSIAYEKGKPTNSEFIAMIADKFYLEGK